MNKNIVNRSWFVAQRYIVLSLSAICYSLFTAPMVRAAITNTAVPGGESPDSAPQQFAVTMATLWQTIIVVGGLAFLLYFLWGGLNWIMAGGDKGKIEKAKGMMTGGAIGLIIIVLSYSITWIVGKALGLNILEPGSIIQGLTFN